MTQISYSQLTPSQKGNIFRLPGVAAFPYTDPDNAIDTAGLSGTLILSQFIDIVNNTDKTLYFKIVGTVLTGDPAKWSGLTKFAGPVGANSTLPCNWDPQRLVPESRTTETLRVILFAYTDPGYTILYGEDYVDYSYQFFDHAQGEILSWADFENALDGWTRSHPGFGVLVSAYAYTGAYSLRLGWHTLDDTHNGEIDSSGQVIPSKTYFIFQTFNLAPYTSAYLVLHSMRQTAGLAPYSDPRVIRVWTATKDFIVRVNRGSEITSARRITLPLPCVNDTIRITASFSARSNDLLRNNWIDAIFIVGFT